MSCSGCQRVRGWLPQSIRERLAEVERRIALRKAPSVSVRYTTKPPLARAASPPPLPEIPPGGDSAGGAQGATGGFLPQETFIVGEHTCGFPDMRPRS